MNSITSYLKNQMLSSNNNPVEASNSAPETKVEMQAQKISTDFNTLNNLESHKIININDIDELNAVIKNLSSILVEEFASKITSQVEDNNLSAAHISLKEAITKTKKDLHVILEKYLEEPQPISAFSRVKRGDWFVLLAKDPDFAKDAKTLFTYAIREFNLALHSSLYNWLDLYGSLYNWEYPITTAKLIVSYMNLASLEIADGNDEGAKAAIDLAKECQEGMINKLNQE